MMKLFSDRVRGSTGKTRLLLFLVVACGGLCLLFFSGHSGPRVTEVTGVIGARYHAGAISFSPDGKLLALPSVQDGRLDLWRINSNEVQTLVGSLSKDNATATHVAFSNDSSYVAVFYRFKGVAIWDLSTEREVTRVQISLPSQLSDLAFVQGRQTLVTIMSRSTEQDHSADRQNYSAVFWEVSTGTIAKSEVFDPMLLFRALSPDGRFAILEERGVPIVFDLATGKKAFDIAPNGGFCFSRDGSAVVSYTGDEVSLWETSTKRESKHFKYRPGFSLRSYDSIEQLLSLPTRTRWPSAVSKKPI